MHSKTQCQVSPGTHVEVLALTGLEELPTTCGVLLFHGQAQSTIRLCEIAGKPPQGKPCPCRVFIKDLQKSHRCWVHFKEGIFCSIHSPPTWSHFSKSEDTAFTIYCLHHRTALTKWHLAFCPSTSLSKELPDSYMFQAHACAPESQEPSCQGFPLILPKLFTQVDQTCLSEPSHTGGPLRMPHCVRGCWGFTFCCTAGLPAKQGPQSHNVHHHLHFPPRCQRCRSSGPRGSCPNVKILPLVLPSVSARWAPAQHHGEYHPCLSSRQSGKSSPPCQRQSVPPCSANRNSPPGASFPCYPVTCPPPPRLPLEPGWADRSHRLAHATLHAMQPQAPPPAPLPYRVPALARTPAVSLILPTAPAVSLRLTAHLHTVRWTQARPGASREARRKRKQPQELQMNSFPPGWRSSPNSTHTAFSPLVADPTDATVTQQWCHRFVGWSSCIHTAE